MVAVVVTLDGVVRDAAAPLLTADDLAAVRGDGIFETLLIRDGHARLVDAHLRRLGHSAAALDLPAPDVAAWRHAIDVAAARWTDVGDGEAALRLVYSRGREGGGPPTAYLTVTPVPARTAVVRRDGVAAMTLDRGLPADGSDLPWLLAGAKTLSYAVNMAALRHAERLGAGDAIFTGRDGQVLEGPRSTVVVAVGDELATPPTTLPILAGTTQAALFDVAAAHGRRGVYRPLRRDDLQAADGVWLVSSVTLAARVHTLDGVALPDTPADADIAALVDLAVTG